MRDVSELADEITEQLAAIGRPERAVAEQRYLKSDLAFLGATVWEIRRIVTAFDRSLDLDRLGLLGLVEELWRPPVHERRVTAVVLMERRASLLRPDDLELVERLIRASRTWALSDGLVGPEWNGGTTEVLPAIRRPYTTTSGTRDSGGTIGAKVLSTTRLPGG